MWPEATSSDQLQVMTYPRAWLGSRHCLNESGDPALYLGLNLHPSLGRAPSDFTTQNALLSNQEAAQHLGVDHPCYMHDPRRHKSNRSGTVLT